MRFCIHKTYLRYVLICLVRFCCDDSSRWSMFQNVAQCDCCVGLLPMRHSLVSVLCRLPGGHWGHRQTHPSKELRIARRPARLPWSARPVLRCCRKTKVCCAHCPTLDPSTHWPTLLVLPDDKADIAERERLFQPAADLNQPSRIGK